MKTVSGLLALFALAGSNRRAELPDQEGTPYPFVVSVQAGMDNAKPGFTSFFFKLTPDPASRYDRDKGMSYAYQVGLGKEDKLLWTTSGWYSFQVYLSRDGRHLVRIGNWPEGTGPKAEDLAIAFYDSGTLLKSYSTLDLLKDPSSVERSVSHYQFLGDGRTGFFDGDDGKDGLFRISLADGTFALFRVKDGSLVVQK